MNILLDTKDLIDLVEHEKPLPLSELKIRLQARGAVLIYSFVNIRGFVGPITLDAESFPRIRGYLEELELLPHGYIRDTTIDKSELESAIRSFTVGNEYEPISPFVQRFDEVFPRFAHSRFSHSHLTYYPLWRIVWDLWQAEPALFSPSDKHRRMHELAMNLDRKKPRKERRSTGLIEPITAFMRVPPELAARLSPWIWSNPSRCPGLRLLREMGMAMSQNTGYASRKDDLFDVSQILVIPYVDAATLDRTMTDYFSRVTRALEKLQPPFPLRCKVFRNVSELLQWMN